MPYLEVYIINRRGDRLRLDPCTGVVTNEEGRVCNAEKVVFYKDGKLAERVIPAPEVLSRRLLDELRTVLRPVRAKS